jgi:hypothetical protein
MRIISKAIGLTAFAAIASGFAGAVHAATPGTPLTATFQVNQSTPNIGPYIGQNIGSDDAGNLTVAWMSDRRVMVRRFGPAGAPLTGEIAVSTAVEPGLASLTNLLPLNSVTAERSPAVAVNRSNGDFIVAWVNDNGGVLVPGLPQLYDFVLVREFDRNGLPKGLPIFVTTTQTTTPDQPFVAMNRSGAFVVAWADRDRVTDFNPYFLNLAWYSGSGQKLGARQQAASIPVLTGAGISADGHMVQAWRESSGFFGECFTPQGSNSGAVPMPAGPVAQTEDGSIVLVHGETGGVYERTYNAACAQVVGDALLQPASANQLGSPAGLAIDSVRNQLAVFGWQYDTSGGTYHATGHLGLFSLSGTAYGAVQLLADFDSTLFVGEGAPQLVFDGQGNLWAAWNRAVWSPATELYSHSVLARGYYGGAAAQSSARR